MLYAAWAEAGLFPRAELLKLRTIRLGSGRASHAAPVVRRCRDGLARPGHLRGDRHRRSTHDGSGRLPHLRAPRRRRVRRGIGLGGGRHRRRSKLDNLCAIVDVNALGQSGPTQFGHDMDELAAPMECVRVAQHRHRRPRHARDSERAARRRARPPAVRRDPGADAERQGRRRPSKARKAGTGRRSRKARRPTARSRSSRSSWSQAWTRPRFRVRQKSGRTEAGARLLRRFPHRAYKKGDLVATREAWGAALAAIGAVDERIVALDADVKNSTFSDRFGRPSPIASSRTSSPSRSWSGCRWGSPRAARFPSRRRSRAF